MLRSFLIVFALLCSNAALFFTLWIVVPAPTYRLWQVAVGASEWSLWFGALGVLGAGLAAVPLAAVGSRAWARLALGLGCSALVLALVPPLQAWPVARANGVELSLRRYLLGSNGGRTVARPQTVTFATVDGQALDLDVYLPPDDTAGRPAIVVVHGGSWSGGDKGGFPRWNRWLAEQGYVVFDIQYRLRQPNWQIATGDVKCAVGWVKRNAARYGVDPERIALLGRSAGGQLALLAAYTPDEPALPPSCETPDTSVRAVVAFYAPTDLVWGYNNPANPDVIDGSGTLRRFLGGDPQTAARAYRIASPVNHVTVQTPPTLLLHGKRDQLVGVQHTVFLSQRLEAAGVPHRTVLIPYGQHGFDYHFGGWGSQIVQPIMLRFLQANL